MSLEELLPILFVAFVVLAALFFWNRSRKRIKPTGEFKEVQRPWEVAKPAPAVVAAEKSWTQRLRSGLSRTQQQLVKGIDEFFLSKETKLSREQIFDQLFELLIRADLGVRTAEKLVLSVREKLSSDESSNSDAIKKVLKEEILAIFERATVDPEKTMEKATAKPHVVLMVGVNGVGKTTTTGKLAFKFSNAGKKVVIGAADTFRAAAVEQLQIWATRAKADFVQLKSNSDPASVAFEAARSAKQGNADLCFVDTAGRLHNRNDLMQELAKIKRSVAKECDGAPHEVLLVLDATTGQNALQQAKVFNEIVQVTGLVLTKLDGTAKGGVAIGICEELGLPIRYVGVGESVEDLEVFNAKEYVDALFSS